MILRRLLLLALVALTGCMAFGPVYTWRFDASMPVCTEVVWTKVEKPQLKGLCAGGSSGMRASDATVACALGCVVVSQYSEEEAKRVMERDGTPLDVHEKRHVLLRERHILNR